MFKWILKFLSLFENKAPEVKAEAVINEVAKKRVAIIIGHGHGDSGAVGNGTDEFAYNSKVAFSIMKSAVHGKHVKLFFRDGRGIGGVNKDARDWGGDLTIELHLNSFNGKARGCEVLTLNDVPSIKMGQSFAKAFCDKFNRVMRNEDGVKELSSKDRGHYALKLVDDAPPSILVESFFIDNKDEWIDSDVYANFIIEWLKGI